jgi:transcriptional regulator with XRE-family HTH domain
MNFGTNLSAARRARAMSQEELADRLNVSRQTIYKWETGFTYPDVDKLCDIARILDVSTAYLLGEAELREDREPPVQTTFEEQTACVKDKAQVVRHYRCFARTVAACTMLILISVAALILFNAFAAAWAEIVSVVQLLCCIAVAVAGYVMAGLRHEAFEKEEGVLPTFEKEERRKAQHTFAFGIVSGLLLIFVGVIFVVIAGFLNVEWLVYVAVASMLALIGMAIYLFITAGIIYDLYAGKEGPRKYHEKEKTPADVVSSIIMLLATAVFLLLGFVWHLWHPAWIAFPLGGLLCGVVSAMFGVSEKKEEEE